MNTHVLNQRSRSWRRFGLMATISIVVMGFVREACASDSIYQPQAMQTVIDRVKATPNAVVVFDVDDTLLYTYFRNLIILRDFAKLESAKAISSADAKYLSTLGGADIAWGVEPTLTRFGIKNADFIKAADRYWNERFFGNIDCEFDPVIPGASEYVNALHQAGATIVYVTGRPEPLMGECTRRGLLKNGFPIDSKSAQLMMKPKAETSDLAFKREAFQSIRSLGPVVGAFENEPANLNAYRDIFPEATIVFVDIAHSLKPDRPFEGALWIRSYLK